MARGMKIAVNRMAAVTRACAMPLYTGHMTKNSPEDFFPRPIGYRLGDGGKDPSAEHCGDWSYGYRTLTSDCIGFVMWALGIDRYQKAGFPEFSGWLNTDSILLHIAAKHEKPWFIPVELKDAKVGDLLVVGSTRSWLGKRKPGHIKMIVRVATPVSPMLVVDCSPSNGAAAVAIKEQAKLGKYRVVRFTGFSDEQ